jgi:hypothetical protein
VLLWLHERTDISNNISNNIYVGNPVQFVIDVQAMQAADQTLWKSSAAQRFGTWTAYAVLRMGPQAQGPRPKRLAKRTVLARTLARTNCSTPQTGLSTSAPNSSDSTASPTPPRSSLA